MNLKEMHEYFDIVQDKYNTPYFTNAEKDMFLSRAGNIFFKSLVAHHIDAHRLSILGGPMMPSILEGNAMNSMSVSPFVREGNISCPTGDILYSDIVTAFGDRSFSHILSVSHEGRPMRWVRHNDIYKHSQNSFKAPTEDRRLYAVMEDRLQVWPSKNSTYKVTGLVDPLPVSYDEVNYGTVDDTSVEPEFLVKDRDRVVAIALDIAGVAVQDEALKLIRNVQS